MLKDWDIFDWNRTFDSYVDPHAVHVEKANISVPHWSNHDLALLKSTVTNLDDSTTYRSIADYSPTKSRNFFFIPAVVGEIQCALLIKIPFFFKTSVCIPP